MRKFNEILSSLRRETGMSQRRAADGLGISQALLSHYENGAREPKFEFVIKACDYYGVTADYLLGRTERREPTGKDTVALCSTFIALENADPQLAASLSALAADIQRVLKRGDHE